MAPLFKPPQLAPPAQLRPSRNTRATAGARRDTPIILREDPDSDGTTATSRNPSVENLPPAAAPLRRPTVPARQQPESPISKPRSAPGTAAKPASRRESGVQVHAHGLEGTLSFQGSAGECRVVLQSLKMRKRKAVEELLKCQGAVQKRMRALSTIVQNEEREVREWAELMREMSRSP